MANGRSTVEDLVSENNPEIPLCVDLDGTLINSDMLIESALLLIKRNPFYLFLMFLWLSRGKAILKREIVSRVELDVESLPYNQNVLDYVKTQSQQRKTVLVTGSDQSIAEAIAAHTGVFTQARGSDGVLNLTNHNKRAWLVETFGKNGFDYIGNDKDDLNVWPDAREAQVVAKSGNVKAFGSQTFSKVFSTESPKFKHFLSMMRVHQWSKNTLVFIPFLLDKSVHSAQNLVLVLLCFLAISLLASATYIVNDLLDLTADRRNATKRKRVIPAGIMPIQYAVVTMLGLGLAVLLLATMLPAAFNSVLLLYLVLTLYYSFVLKQRLIIDVCTLAGLHTIRVIAGTVAVAAQWSFWLLAFSMFLFFSLAVAKRVAELSNLKLSGRDTPVGRAYRVGDLPMLSAMGVATGYISVLVIALFVNSDKVRENYSEPVLLWLLCPLLMYWIGRLWVIAARGALHEDPIVFAVRDRLSQIVFSAVLLVVIAASFTSPFN